MKNKKEGEETGRRNKRRQKDKSKYIKTINSKTNNKIIRQRKRKQLNKH